MKKQILFAAALLSATVVSNAMAKSLPYTGVTITCIDTIKLVPELRKAPTPLSEISAKCEIINGDKKTQLNGLSEQFHARPGTEAEEVVAFSKKTLRAPIQQFKGKPVAVSITATNKDGKTIYKGDAGLPERTPSAPSAPLFPKPSL